LPPRTVHPDRTAVGPTLAFVELVEKAILGRWRFYAKPLSREIKRYIYIYREIERHRDRERDRERERYRQTTLLYCTFTILATTPCSTEGVSGRSLRASVASERIDLVYTPRHDT
jgi:RNase P/RNase MRP subunit p30